MDLTARNLRQHPALYFDASELDNPPGSFVRVRYQPTSDTYAVTLTSFDAPPRPEPDDEVFVFATSLDLYAAFAIWGEHLHLRDTWQPTSVTTNAVYWS